MFEMQQEIPQDLIRSFVRDSARILGDQLVGIYLHGSAAMGCYHPKKSDLDFMIVVKDGMTEEVKRAFMDRIVKLNANGPAKGIEMSIVRQEVCDPFVYPTPFELHFSVMHLGWYLEDPVGYVRKMNGTDKDLAAHFTMIRRRGECLYGAPIKIVFGEVPVRDYIDSLWYDIEGAADEIEKNTMYLTLNLTRMLAYLKEGQILSKQEGGEWGILSLPEKYNPILLEALREYQGEEPAYDLELAKEYAQFMLSEIRKLVKEQA